MVVLDALLLGVLGLSMVIGAWRGLVYETLSLLNWVVAFVLAQWWAQDAADWLPMSGASAAIRYAAGFVSVFLVGLFSGGLLVVLVRKLVSAVGLRPIDRVLGGLFGVVRGAVVILVGVALAGLTPLVQAAWWQESQGARLASTVLQGLRPLLPDAFQKYLN